MPSKGDLEVKSRRLPSYDCSKQTVACNPNAQVRGIAINCVPDEPIYPICIWSAADPRVLEMVVDGVFVFPAMAAKRFKKDLKEGTMVLPKEEFHLPLTWPIWSIVALLPGKDGLSRTNAKRVSNTSIAPSSLASVTKNPEYPAVDSTSPTLVDSLSVFIHAQSESSSLLSSSSQLRPMTLAEKAKPLIMQVFKLLMNCELSGGWACKPKLQPFSRIQSGNSPFELLLREAYIGSMQYGPLRMLIGIFDVDPGCCPIELITVIPYRDYKVMINEEVSGGFKEVRRIKYGINERESLLLVDLIGGSRRWAMIMLRRGWDIKEWSS
ncbi:hypothetical protein J437_LFUL008394 [Ladona fulva]|uniref:Uncharacterized protein n=1 Tax=Ladona fulva TaxID=123851 RepID=A0A8K0K3A7_LADFU|nr:hypothetical protein J437_LFUL008394 [Ladona fulva]